VILAQQPSSNKLPNIRFVQVTDSHLYADPNGVLVGMNCEEGLQDVLAMIDKDEPALAAVLCTGDISQDYSKESYLRFYQLIGRLNAPQYWIPGNHDELSVMQEAIGSSNPCFKKSFAVTGWRIIMLNSHVAGAVSGTLPIAELQFLEQQLSAADHAHVLICLHHNCLPVDAAWLQQHALTNPQDLFAIVDRFKQVKAVLFGHIHQEYQRSRNGVGYFGSPSTCIQFHPSKADFALDDLNPGYRWLELCSNGEVLTGVKRVANKRYPVDFFGVGY
jgi:3',5'-cyclic-AMP phosphodiesterase